MATDRDDDRDDRDDDRPSRRRRDDDYDDRRPAKAGGMDGFLGNTPVAIILAIVFFCFCPLAGLIIGGIGMAQCKDPGAKRNAMIMLVLSLLGIVVGLISNFVLLPMLQRQS